MKARILGLALVGAGFTAPAVAENADLSSTIQHQGIEATQSLRDELSIQPTSQAQFDQMFADMRALPVNRAVASVETDAEQSASASPAVLIGEATQSAVSRAVGVKSASESSIVRLTVGLGMFGLPWKQ